MGEYLLMIGHMSMDVSLRELRPSSLVSWDSVAEYCIIQVSARLMDNGHKQQDVKVIFDLN